MPFKQQLANRIIERYLQGYSNRMRAILNQWPIDVTASDPNQRRDELVRLWQTHEVCHKRAFNSMRLKPPDWDAELSAISWALTSEKVGVSADDVEFALIERDTETIEDVASKVLTVLDAGFTDSPEDFFVQHKDLTLAERAFKWHHGQLYNVGGAMRRVLETVPRADRIADHEGVPDIQRRLESVAQPLIEADAHLRDWLNAHIDDQPK